LKENPVEKYMPFFLKSPRKGIVRKFLLLREEDGEGESHGKNTPHTIPNPVLSVTFPRTYTWL